MSIDYNHLSRVTAEMEQGVTVTTKHNWLDLAEEVIRLREHIVGLMTVMENKAATGSSPQDPAIIAGYLKEIVLGDNDEY